MSTTVCYPVVGVSFENRQETLEKFYGGYHVGSKSPAVLLTEDDNPYDKNAVAVCLVVDDAVSLVGYISRDQNAEVRSRISSIRDTYVNSIGRSPSGLLGLTIAVEYAQDGGLPDGKPAEEQANG